MFPPPCLLFASLRWPVTSSPLYYYPCIFSRAATISSFPARRAQDSSPVRQHWENDGPASAPERGGRTRAAAFYRPVSGLANAARPLPTALRRGLLSCALRALRAVSVAACRYVGQLGKLRAGCLPAQVVGCQWPIDNRPQLSKLPHTVSGSL